MMQRIILLFFMLSFYACNRTEPKDMLNINSGVNISHWLSQSKRRGMERADWFTQNDMIFIASQGFDHIRLPVDEEQLWDSLGNKEPEAFELLHKAIGWAKDAGLDVIVDLHIVRSHHFNEKERPLWSSELEQQKFITFWEQLSNELSDYPNELVAYEILNEAVADDPESWNVLLNKTIAKIRETEPERKIVVGSNMWQSVFTFKDLRIPENDPNLILSFHFYHPLVLTHYTASWNILGLYRGPVHYPGQVVPTSEMDTLKPNLKKEVELWGGYYTIDSMRVEIALPVNYAKNAGLPLYCGEYGSLPAVPSVSRYAWYTDLTAVLNENGVGRAVWDYKGGFGIVRRSNSAGNNFEPDTILIKIITSR